MRFALIKSSTFYPSALPTGWRVARRIDGLAVLLEGPDAGPLPDLDGLTEIDPDTAAILKGEQ